MPKIKLTMDLEKEPWLELAKLREEGKVITAMGNEAADLWLGAIPGRMTSGEPSLAIAIQLPDGTFVVSETSLKLLISAADILKAAYYGEELTGQDA